MTQQGGQSVNNSSSAPSNNHPDNIGRSTPSTTSYIHVNNTATVSSIHHHHPHQPQQQYQPNQAAQQPHSNQQPHMIHAPAVPVIHTNPVQLTMPIHPVSQPTHMMSPSMTSHSIVATSPSARCSPLPPLQPQMMPNTSTFQPNSNDMFFQKDGQPTQMQSLAHQARLQHTQSLQHSYNVNQQQQQQKLSHQQSLPERGLFAATSGSAVAYANAHLLTSVKNNNVTSMPTVSHVTNNPLNSHPNHQHHHHDLNTRNHHHVNHMNANQKQSHQHHLDQQQPNQSHTHHHGHHHKSKHPHSGSRSSLVSNMGPGNTQTLPHPRSQQSRSNHAVVNVNTATLGRRSSLFIVSIRMKLFLFEINTNSELNSLFVTSFFIKIN